MCNACRVMRTSLLALLVLSSLAMPGTFAGNFIGLVPPAHSNVIDPPTSIAPSMAWGTLFGTSGDVEIDLNRTGIAVRIEIPREFLSGVVYVENDTHFIESNIRNDYYYYNVVDESLHWTYDWRGIQASDGPCFKPKFSLHDPNAPWCVEIWNYVNGTFLTFTPPKFVRFLNLRAPSIAGTYNFTVFVADHENSIGYPDFVNAWNTTLFVPVSMQNDPASISGTICDSYFSPSCPLILGTKGIAYAQSYGQIVARSYVNETTGQFNLTGLAPGTYQILASAGFDPFFDTSYSQFQYISSVTVVQGGKVSIGSIPLTRSPELCGTISYLGVNNQPLANALSGDPYLIGTGLSALNITVEATDGLHVYRNATIVAGNAPDAFTIVMGSNESYVGTDPYGTEFAGLPPVTGGSYQLTVNVWIAGYVQKTPATVTVSTYMRSMSVGSSCNQVSPNPIVMNVGGAIFGTIQFWNQAQPETPDQAEASLPIGTVTGALFGGNILIQIYDSSGILRGVSVINGTAPNRTTLYKDSSSVPFEIFGFDEYLNHTWSGVWDERDSGLAADPGYSIQVSVRGYEEEALSPIGLTLGGSAYGVQVKMLRGGAFELGVFSYDNRLGTRAIQAPIAFPFLNLSIPIRGRTYFYDSAGQEVGFVECILRVNVTQPDPLCHLGTVPGIESEENSFTVIFAGQNWSLREIWFYGDIPTHVTNDNYTIKTYILSYVWQFGPTIAQNSLLGFTQVGVPLLLGDEIDITGPIFVNQQILGQLPENDFVIGQAFSQTAGLAGAAPGNITAGIATLGFRILGFGGITQSNGTLNGQGHFFYESPSGSLFFDYGLDNTTSYTAQVPEFGFNTHFMQPVPPVSISFSDLFLEEGVAMEDIQMATVSSSSAYVTGWVSSDNSIIALSWVSVIATNSSFSRTATTLDGQYLGPGALFLPQGTYTITFTNPYFVSQALVNLYVQWGSSYAVLPPNGPLCPLVGTCDPPSSPASNHTTITSPFHSIVTWIVAWFSYSSECLKRTVKLRLSF